MAITLNPVHLHQSSLKNVSVSLFSGVTKTHQSRGFFSFQIACSTDNHREKVVVIVGGTGTGKSKLSIDIALKFSGEIINSDKIQIYKGLDIAGNKMPAHERQGVPHHLLGVLNHDDPEYTPAEFRSFGTRIISGITSRGRLPIIAGGSNSLVYALLAERFDPETKSFKEFGSICSDLRYDCCFLWVDVAMPVLFDYLSKRVDEMLEAGMLGELEQYFESEESASQTGLRKTIGVPEFESYFGKRKTRSILNGEEGEVYGDYEEAVRETKENTCELVKRQLGKILGLRGAGWYLHSLDATAAVRERLTSSGKSEEWSKIWKRDMVEPSVKIVRQFLEK